MSRNQWIRVLELMQSNNDDDFELAKEILKQKKMQLSEYKLYRISNEQWRFSNYGFYRFFRECNQEDKWDIKRHRVYSYWNYETKERIWDENNPKATAWRKRIARNEQRRANKSPE